MSSPADRRQFSRIWVPDDRDKNYPMEPLLAASRPTTLPDDVSWALGPVLDQGALPECVGYGSEGWLNCAPLVTMDGPTPDQIYAGAQKVDGIPGPHDGTTVRAAFQFLRGQGRVVTFLWASSAKTVMEWLLTRGSVVLGVPWFSDMDEPAEDGAITPTGTYRGGHCILAYRAERLAGRIWIRNSWGPEWGIHGAAYLKASDLDVMLKQMHAEAAAAVECPPHPLVVPDTPENPETNR